MSQEQKLPPLVMSIAGFGTVGGGLVRIIMENKAEILTRCGREIRIKHILVRDTSRTRATTLPEGTILTTNMEDILGDPEVELVVELMGGIDKPRDFITRALNAGKHVVTANKALLAETGTELFELAQQKGLHLGYEASVCGGIPIVQAMREGLAANRILYFTGILNGTCNYILSEMSTKGLPFNDALSMAQKLGYAEADPTLDIEGYDTAHKLNLMIRLSWGVDYPYFSLPVTGITGVSDVDIKYAKEFGYRIKLLAYAKLNGDNPATGGIEAGVAPTLVHEDYLMASVTGSYNAVRVTGNAVEHVFLHGRGAGDLPTGSAVAADVLDVARGGLLNNTGYLNPPIPGKAKIADPSESTSAFYVRLLVSDKPGVLREIAEVMSANDISIAQIIQKDENNAPAGSNTPVVPFIMMTHEAKTAGLVNAMRTLADASFVHEAPVYFRVLRPGD